MTAAELIDALRAANVHADEGEGITIREVVDSSRGMLSEKVVRDLLRQMIADGKVRVSRRLYVALDGRRAQVPSYVLIEDAPRVKRGRAKAA